MTATIDHVVSGQLETSNKLTAANAVRAKRAAERYALEAARRLRHLDQRWLAALALAVEQEQQRRDAR